MQDVAPLSKGGNRRAQRDKPTDEKLAEQARANALGLTPAVDPNYLTAAEVPPIEPLAVLAWKKDGVQPAVFARLKGGGYPPEHLLDLHGMTVREARTAVYRLFERAAEQGLRVVLIAHGKGEKSPTPGRLKSFVAHWLTQNPDVNAWHSAPGHMGGVGAVLVLLRKSKRLKEENRARHDA